MKRKTVLAIVVGAFVFFEFGADAVQDKNLPHETMISNSIDEFDMVTITPEMYSNELAPFIDHKNAVGIRTFFKTTEEIYEEYDCRDQAEQIKYFIYESVNDFDIEYVLLIGDVHTTPIRKTEVNHIWPGWTTQTDDFITDLYYADIYNANGSFSSWDSNNDNVFSEFYLYNYGENTGEIIVVDEVDLYPDISVGRIPCENKDELTIVINKIIKYETQSNDEWFNRIILAGSDGFSEPGHQFEMVTERIAETMNEFKPIKLYESTDTLSPTSINNYINNGAGFFVCSSHGSPGSFHNYLKRDIDGLHNDNKLPIVFLIGCYCAQLDSSLIYNVQIILLSLSLQIANNPNGNNHALEIINLLKQKLNTIDSINLRSCIAWDLLKYEYGGSIATIGGTRSGTLLRYNPTGGFQGFFTIKFFELYQQGISLSQMFNEAVSSFINESWKNQVRLQRFILLGDPSLKIGGWNIDD